MNWRKLLVAAFVALLAVPFANLQPADALTVSPVRFEYEAEPGDTIVGTVKLRNETETTQTYFPTVEDFVAGEEEDGTPQFVGEASTRSIVNWVSFERGSVQLEPGEDSYAIFRISVPQDAAPGGYYAGLLFSSQDPDVDEGVGAVSQTGPIVLLDVAGDVSEQADIVEFDAEPNSTTSLPVNFVARVENSGDVHLQPQGVIRITNMLGTVSAMVPVNQDSNNILPDSTRRFAAMWQKAELPENASELVKEWKNFGFGPYTATLLMQYGENEQVISSQASFWVMPWMLIVLGLILLVILVLLLMQYNRWIVSRATKAGK